MTNHEEFDLMLARVDNFAAAMKDKLRIKFEQGYFGGLDPCYRRNVEGKLAAHVRRQLAGENQEIDIANLAMMLWKKP